MSSGKERIIPIVLEVNSRNETIRSSNRKINQIPSSSEALEEETQKDTEIEEYILNDLLNSELPTYNVPEKIIIAIDRSHDENDSDFVISGINYSPLNAIKKAVEVFIHNKLALNPSHQFALMCLTETNSEWLHDFTNSPQDIISSISLLRECESKDVFDLRSGFELINRKIYITKGNSGYIPNYVFRLILIYGRSYTMLKLEETDEIEELLKSPYFTVDSIMTHEPISTANCCEKNFQHLQYLDKKGFSYCFAVARNAADLYASMAKLLSHPLQRPPQKDAKYILEKSTDV